MKIDEIKYIIKSVFEKHAEITGSDIYENYLEDEFLNYIKDDIEKSDYHHCFKIEDPFFVAGYLFREYRSIKNYRENGKV